MNKMFFMLTAILMSLFMTACSNTEDGINTEWGSEDVIPGELVPTCKAGNIHILWERPHIEWFVPEYMNKLDADVKWVNPYKYPEGIDKDYRFQMMGVNKCNSLTDLATIAARLYCHPNQDNRDSATITFEEVKERLMNNFPEDVDFQNQSVFLFYFFAPNTWNTVALFTNPKNNRPVFMCHSRGDYLGIRLAVYRPHAGLMGYIVVDSPDLSIRDIELWTKIGNIEVNTPREEYYKFFNEYPDWKVKEWGKHLIYPELCHHEYFGDTNEFYEGKELFYNDKQYNCDNSDLEHRLTRNKYVTDWDLIENLEQHD